MMHEADLLEPAASDKMNVQDDVSTEKPINTLTEEQRNILQLELDEIEEEIYALKVTLQSRISRANELKGLLGYGVLTEFRHDLLSGLTSLRQSESYAKTTEALKTARGKTASALTGAKDVVSHKLDDVKNSATFKNVQGALGNAYTGVMGVFSGSAFGYGTAAADEEVEEALEVTADHEITSGDGFSSTNELNNKVNS